MREDMQVIESRVEASGRCCTCSIVMIARNTGEESTSG
jgi:hypothetical protein